MFYLVDPAAGDELETYDTLDEALLAGEVVIGSYREYAGDDGWSEEMGNIAVYRGEPGLVWDDVLLLPRVARATEKDRVDRPDDVDEEGYSESLGDHWMGDFDYMCDYQMVKVG